MPPSDVPAGGDVVAYGPDIPTEAELRLLGHLPGKRVLELGCGDGHRSIAAAKQGGHVIGVDASAERLALARRGCEREGVRVELHQGDLADLAFVRADTVDVAFSVGALGQVEDLGRVFRQVHRVLKPQGPLVFSLPHPASHLVDPDSDQPRLIRRSYFDRGPVERREGATSVQHHHTVAALVTGLVRAGFRVDAVLEPEPVAGAERSPAWREAFRWVPPTLILRARKEGI